MQGRIGHPHISVHHELLDSGDRSDIDDRGAIDHRRCQCRSDACADPTPTAA